MAPLARPVSVNLRTEHLDAAEQAREGPGYYEVIADNWLSEGPHHRKLARIAESSQIFFHCVGMNLAGFDPLNRKYFAALAELSTRWQPVHISDHLCVQALHGCYVHDLLPFPLNRESLKRVTERVHVAQDLLGRALVIENLSYYVAFQNSTMSEAEFLNALAKSTGCGLLLDLNNIEMNHRNGLCDRGNFLNELDFSRIREIHVAGGELTDAMWVDTHGSEASPEVYSMLSGIRALYPDVPVIYEWDHQVPDFGALMDMARKAGACG